MKIESPDLKRHVLSVFACGVIAVVELGVRTGWLALAMALFLIVLGSRRAQVLWASVLLVGLGFRAVFKDADVVVAVEADALFVRVLFLTVMAALGWLFATHRLAHFLRTRIESIRPPVWFGFAGACLVFCAGILIFDIVHWYRYASWAALFFVLAWRCPKPARGGKSTWSKRATNGTLTLVTVVLCLVLVEVGLRVFVAPSGYVIKGAIIRAHETAGFTYRENSTQSVESQEFKAVYSINSQGLRGRFYGKKGQDVYRIVCLGDSLTFGDGVSEEAAYPRVLERDFARSHPERSIEVVNMGTAGYGLWQSEIKFREIGLALEPDLLVVQVFPDNDVRDALRREGIVLQAYEASYHDLMDNLDNIRGRLRTRQLRSLSRTFDLLHYVLQPKYRFALSKLRPQFRGDMYDERVVERPQSVARDWSVETLLKEPYPDLELGFELLEQSIADLVELGEELGIPVVILYIPGVRTTYVEWTLQWLEGLEMEASIYDFRRASDWMDDVCAAHGWPLVNTKETFDRHTKTEKDLMYPENGHPTDRGHRLVADLLGEYIETTYLLGNGGRNEL